MLQQTVPVRKGPCNDLERDYCLAYNTGSKKLGDEERRLRNYYAREWSEKGRAGQIEKRLAELRAYVDHKKGEYGARIRPSGHGSRRQNHFSAPQSSRQFKLR